MDPRAAKGIAANIREIAENVVIVTLADSGDGKFLNRCEARSNAVAKIEKSEARIAGWLMQPMTLR